MKISVVTAVMNGGNALGRAVDSLKLQGYTNLEHIVQDGGSTDGTLDYLADHGHPAMSLQSRADGGIYEAINRGIRRATGDVIGLLHADDTLASNNVLGQISVALQDPTIDGIYGDLEYVARDNPDRVIRYWKAGPYARPRLSRGWMPPHPTLYLRREVFARAGLYDTSYRISGDYDGMLRWLTKGRIRLGYIPQVMVRMQIGGASNRSFAQMLRKSREDYRAIKQNDVGGIGTLIAKNLSKLPQFSMRPSDQ